MTTPPPRDDRNAEDEAAEQAAQDAAAELEDFSQLPDDVEAAEALAELELAELDYAAERAARGLDPLSNAVAAMAREPWRITGDKTAAWALRKVAEAEAEVQRLNDSYLAELQRLEAWRDRAVAGPTRTVGFFSEHLIRYRRHLEALADAGRGPKVPGTYKVATGDIARRKATPKAVLTDPEAFILWALENERGDLVKMTPQVSPLKAAAGPYSVDMPVGDEAAEGAIITPTDDGELVEVPGVLMVRDAPTYSVKPRPAS